MDNEDIIIKLKELAKRLKKLEICKFEKYINQIQEESIPEIEEIFNKDPNDSTIEHVPDTLKPKFVKSYIYINNYEDKETIQEKLGQKSSPKIEEKYNETNDTDIKFKKFIKNFNKDLIAMKDKGNELLDLSKKITISYHYIKSNP